MPNAVWKDAERRVAERLGTKRTPLSGKDSRITASDTLHEDLFVEVKYGKSIPLWEDLRDLRQRARRFDKMPLLLIEPYDDRDPTLGNVMMVSDMEGFEASYKGISWGPSPIALFESFLVEHVPHRDPPFGGLWEDTVKGALDEGKKPVIACQQKGSSRILTVWGNGPL